MTGQDSQSLRREIIDRKITLIRNLEGRIDINQKQIENSQNVIVGCARQIADLRIEIAQLNGETA